MTIVRSIPGGGVVDRGPLPAKGRRPPGRFGNTGTLQALTRLVGRSRSKAPKRFDTSRRIPPAKGLRRRFPGAPAGMHPSEINNTFGGGNNSGGATAPRTMSPARRQYRATHGRNYRQRHPWREQRDPQKQRILY